MGSIIQLTDPTAVNGQTYYYKVSIASNNSFTWPQSNELNVISQIAVPLTVTALAINPSSVTGGASTDGTVTMSGSAPTNGVTVFLSNDAQSLGIPSNVFVPAGTTSALFPMTTTAVTASATINIMATYNGVSKSATLMVNPAPPVLTSIAVSPTNATLTTGGTQTFTAVAEDQNGTALATQPVFTWTSAGVGTVTSVGIYSAGSTAGSATVKAASGTVSGTAAVTVGVATPPAAPTNVSVYQSGTGVLGAGVDVSWVGPPTAATYNIYRSTQGGGPYILIHNTSNPTDYTDNTTTIGTFYYYVVTSVSVSGSESVFSNETNVVPLAAGSSSADIPAPEWAEGALPTDDAAGGDFGPSASNNVNLASGVEENHPGPDLVAFNPVGPAASYERQYRSTITGSPGLSAGWADNYDMTVRAGTGGQYVLSYPNGATDIWSPGSTSGSLTPPHGAPYLVSSTGTGFTMTLPSHSVYSFALNPNNASSTVYRLVQITNAVGHSITIARDSTDRLVSVSNDASPATTLLSFTYSGAYLLTAADAYGRKTTYGFAGGTSLFGATPVELVTVSKLNLNPLLDSGMPRWKYSYYGTSLHTVAVPDPGNPGTTSMSSSTIGYGAGGVVSSVMDANKNTHSYTYAGNMTLVQTFTYQAAQYPTPAALVLARQWLKDYDSTKNNVETIDNDANNHQSQVTYSGTPSVYLPDSVTNRNSQKTSISYDPATPSGNVRTIVDPRNTATNLSYDPSFPLGQVQSAQTGAQAASTYDYYSNGFLHDAYTPLPELLSGSNTTTYTYDDATDKLGNVKTVTTPGANGPVTVSYEYHMGYNGYTQAPTLGEPVAVTVTGPDALGGTTSTVTYYQYDNRGNRTAVIDALGNETDFQYNLADQLTETIYPPTSTVPMAPRSYTLSVYSYPGSQVLTEQTFDESNTVIRRTDYTYGSEGELLQTNNGNQGSRLTSTYIYDGLYRLSKFSDGVNADSANKGQTAYSYDPAGNRVSTTYPDTKPGFYDKMQYSYDADNNLTKRVDGNGVETDYLRPDPESLLKTIHYPGGQLPDVNFNYDVYGRRTSMTDQTGSKSYTYDDLDNLLTQTTSFAGGPQNQILTYHYYSDGSRKQMVTPLGGYGYQYDGLSRLAQTTFPWTGGLYNSSYYANGWLRQTQGPKTLTSYGYNGRGFLTSLTNTVPGAGTLLSSFTGMAYDGVGNRGSETTTIPSVGQAPDMGRTVYYGYGDGPNSFTYSGNQMNLTGESSRGTGNNYTLYVYSLIYDNRGNPHQQSATSGVSNSVGANSGANADDQLTSSLSNTFNYDGNGNLILDYQKPLTFDVENRLLNGSIQGSTGYLKAATYDGDGLRTSKTNGSSAPLYFLNDGSTPILEENSGGAVVTANGWGPDGWRMRYTPGQQYFAYTYDPQGNRVQRHSQTGDVAYDVSQFDAFGNDTAHYFVASSTSSRYLDPCGFGGQYGYYTDVETGLVLLTHRYYDPTFGRFVTRDPIGYAGGANLYSLGNYNPVNHSDPNGTSGASAAGEALIWLVKLVERNGIKYAQYIRPVSMRTAQGLRARGQSIVVQSQKASAARRVAKRIEDSVPGETIEHGPHNEPNIARPLPHYQTNGALGHTYYSGALNVVGFLLPLQFQPEEITPETKRREKALGLQIIHLLHLAEHK